jgi:predicted GNAT family acetyltransferase
MAEPIFTDGECRITDNQGHVLALSEKTWSQHIIRDRARGYLEHQFEKVVQTVEAPERIIESKQEKNVIIYERRFDDLFITDTVFARAFFYVVANRKTGRIRTVYTNPNRRQQGQVIWEIQSSR